MAEFIGRERELSVLERIYSGSKYKTCAVLGRRRIGKTALIDRFCEGKPHLKFSFYKGTEESNMRIINEVIRLSEGTDPGLTDFTDFVSYLKGVCAGSKTVVVFDEYTFLASSGDHISSAVQHFVDWMVSNTDSMLIICGSIVSMMEDELCNRDRPLYGRFLSRIDLGPLTFQETRLFHPGMDDMDLIRLYLTVGGVPLNHIIMNEGTYADNIRLHFMDENSEMVSEALSSIYRELDNGDKYIPVLSAISGGESSIKTISEKAHLPESTATLYVDRLVRIGLVGSTVPMAGAPKRPAYRIVDPVMSFYQSVLVRNIPILSNRSSDPYGLLHASISSHLGHAFEDLCAEYIVQNYPCTSIGKWWGSVPILGDDGVQILDRNGRPMREDVDIDVVARVMEGEGHADLFVECKFRNRPMEYTALTDLVERVASLKGHFRPRLMLMSPSGFTESLRDEAERRGVVLIGLDELMGRDPAPPLMQSIL